jgi:DUF1365 family protein
MPGEAAPALYVGRLRHRRFGPRPHAFTYRLFMACVDIDRLDEQMAVSRLTSVNRFNWATFDDRDHLGDPAKPLRERLRQDAAAAGHVLPGGRILLLTHLRYLGYNFNPISFYYCHDPAGRLRLVLGEVRNTFGGLCTYWLPAEGGAAGPERVRARVPKVMHVSPFMSMEVDYAFALTPPGDSIVAHMETFERGAGDARPYFDATLTLERRPWTAAAWRRVLARHPLMTAAVIGAIHWQALRLWMKGLPFHPHPEGGAGRRTGRQEVA